jgi:hypothetical protein
MQHGYGFGGATGICRRALPQANHIKTMRYHTHDEYDVYIILNYLTHSAVCVCSIQYACCSYEVLLQSNT